MDVPILKQGRCLVASVQDALTDADMLRFQRELMSAVDRHRSGGVIIDVTALDVLGSFGTRTIGAIARALSLRGAETVVVGIQPDVAFAMVQLGLTFDDLTTALDLEEGLAVLGHLLPGARGNA